MCSIPASRHRSPPSCRAPESRSAPPAARRSWTTSSCNPMKLDSKARFRTAFGRALGQSLAARSMTFHEGATAVGVTRAYVSQLSKGERHPSPQWLDLVADTLQMTEEERVRLHRAAAADKGYKLDLTK